MDPILAIIWSRTAERLLVIVAGIAAIWIGYRLFALMPSRRDGESKIELPGGVSILLSRVGPGTLFALFGAGLIAYSAASPVKYERSDSLQSAADGSQTSVKLQSMTNAQEIKTAPKPPRPAASLAPEASILMINTWLAETTAGRTAKPAAKELWRRARRSLQSCANPGASAFTAHMTVFTNGWSKMPPRASRRRQRQGGELVLGTEP